MKRAAVLFLFCVALPTTGAADFPREAWDCDHAPSPRFAIDACTRAIESCEASGAALASVFRGRAIAYAAVNKYDEAFALFPNGELLVWRGDFLAKQGNEAEAINNYGRAIELVGPSLAVGFRQRGIAYRAVGMPEKSISDFSHIVSLNPDFAAEAYILRAWAYNDIGDQDNARDDYRKALSIDPQSAKQRDPGGGMTPEKWSGLRERFGAF